MEPPPDECLCNFIRADFAQHFSTFVLIIHTTIYFADAYFLNYLI